jgi:NAD(P)-dependent dehydrogenase (short-subunit alcohol dehydrogenase family)
MEGDPISLGSPLMSKPTWSNTEGCSATSAFFDSAFEQTGERGKVESDRRCGQGVRRHAGDVHQDDADGRLGRAEEMASAIFASDESSFTTGIDLAADGGLSEF